jgi:glycine betaine transporter
LQDIEREKAIERERSEVGVVFWVSAAVALAFILWGVIAPESFGAVTQAVFDWVVSNLGWFYLLAGNFFLIFVVILALSRYGKFRLGKEGERPEFSTFAWFAMLFQAGMGPALLFWGVAAAPLKQQTHHTRRTRNTSSPECMIFASSALPTS